MSHASVYYTDLVTWRQCTKTGPYKAKSFSDVANTRCKLEYGNKLVRAMNGEQLVSSVVVRMAAKPGPDDEFILPDGQTRTVLSIGSESAWSVVEWIIYLR